MAKSINPETKVTRRSLSLVSAFALGMKAARIRARSLTQRYFSLVPIDFVRYREFQFIFERLNQEFNERWTVLDIGSPKLVPLNIASAFPKSTVFYTNILEREIDDFSRDALVLGIGNVTAELQDARSLRFPDESFDLVTSVSVFEHISPEQGGDIRAAREMGRVLRTNGIALLTVPFSNEYFAEFRRGTVYERSPERKGERIFFQRFYDMDTLQRNIAKASGLFLESVTFIEERFFFRDPKIRVAQFINGNFFQTVVFGPLYPALAKIFLTSPKELSSCRKPYIACLVLRKV